MNSRKRVECVLEQKEPDRIPWDSTFHYKTYDNLKKYVGIDTGPTSVLFRQIISKIN